MTKSAVSVVTGAAGGIGRACVDRFAALGDAVVLVDVAEAVDDVASGLRASGAMVTTVKADLADRDAVAMIAETAGELGRLRAVAHTAGLSPTMAGWERVLSVNLTGTVLLLDAIEPLVTEATAAVCVASQAGHLLTPDDDVAAVLSDPLAGDFLDRAAAAGIDDPGAAYAFSKWAVRRLVVDRAAAWGARGARIVSLSPGIVDTPMGRQEMAHQEAMAAIVDLTPLQRIGDADEIAAVIEFLCSDAASFVTGTDLLVDGGSTEAVLGAMTDLIAPDHDG